jgi:hypothetical protein
VANPVSTTLALNLRPVSLTPVANNKTSECLHFKVKGKKFSMFTLCSTQRCPNKLNKTFLIEDFFHLPLVSLTPVVHLELQISPRIFDKNFKWHYRDTQGHGGN